MLLDQIVAIKFVNENINSFGGSGEKVTVFGESAGGMSICAILISPVALEKDIKIQRAIIHSGPCIGGWGGGETTYDSLTRSEKYAHVHTIFLLLFCFSEREMKLPPSFVISPEGRVMIGPVFPKAVIKGQKPSESWFKETLNSI